MADTRRTRALTATAISLGVILVPVAGWASLPVTRDPGPIQLYARPAGVFSDEFAVRVVNRTDRPRYVPVTASPFLLMPRCAEESTFVESHASLDLRPTGATWPGHAQSGLHRYSLHCGEARTDVWVLGIGGRSFAIK